VPHIELDALWWTPGWLPVGADELRARLAQRLERATEGWVVDGNYLDEIGPSLVDAIDTVVWLDVPRTLAVARATRRSVRRVLVREQMWEGNRESFSTLAPWSLASLWRRWPEYDSKIGTMVDALPRSAAVVRASSTAGLSRPR
jgi:adenylate kinase family enzyme